MTLSQELAARGFVNQTTLSNPEQLDDKQLTFYLGVDPSADSMHIGQLAMAMMVRHFIEHGHKPILLVGGATGMIGDPDGKDQERDLKTIQEIEHNKAGIAQQYRTLFAGQDFEVVDNYDWFKELGYLNFLRDVGKHFSMTQLLDRDFVQKRIGAGGSGISYAEFSYSLIQGYDFLHLFREKGVTLQISGADQWGNSISGVDLIRRLEGAEAHVWTAPLVINKSTGRKFGKSEAGTVWLDSRKTSVYQFYQFLLNSDDQSVGSYLRLFTMLPLEEIEQIQSEHAQNPGARTAQKRLAYEVTMLVHGQERADSVVRVTEVLFGDRNISELDQNDLESLAAEIPTAATGQSVVEALVACGAVGSNGEARRLLGGGAISLNGEKLTDDIRIDQPSLLKKGKNSFVLVR